MKTLRETAVRLENKPGALLAISELLGANGINILGLTVRTEGDVGYMHFISTDPARVGGVLSGAGYTADMRDVLAIETPHHPGGLQAMLKPLKTAGVNVEYLYSCIGVHGSGDSAIVILGVDNSEAAYGALSKDWIRIFGEELYGY